MPALNLSRGHLFLSVMASLSLSACGPTIGLQTNFQDQHFELGKTTRTEVVNRLGLPQKIITDAGGLRHYFYEGGTHLASLCVGCGYTNVGPGLIPSLIYEAGVKNGAEYVFDAHDSLVAKFEPATPP